MDSPRRIRTRTPNLVLCVSELLEDSTNGALLEDPVLLSSDRRELSRRAYGQEKDRAECQS